ncbi:MAG: formylglycine-generating enzyme family protein [Planctomycetota bacterium]|jgi:formylglycine-generating enzyme required for sulfatase activity
MMRTKDPAVLLIPSVLALATCGGAPSRPGAPAWARLAPAQLAAAKEAGIPAAFENDLGMRFVLVPGGSFQMGSPADEQDREEEETVHHVTLSKPYYVQVFEVRNSQYRRWKPEHDPPPYNGLALDGDDRPAVHVNWNDAVAFAAWLSQRDPERTYRLPTEAEWERACRAGATTRYSWGGTLEGGWLHANGNDVVTEDLFGWAWSGFPEDDGHRVTAPVGSYKANAWGLHDMHGNVWEWCLDEHVAYDPMPATDPQGGTYGAGRILRGGAWNHYRGDLRSARRHYAIDLQKGGNVGFRLVCVAKLP